MIKTKEDIVQLLKTIQENDAVAAAEIPPTVPFKDVLMFQRSRANAAETAYQRKVEYKAYVEQHIGAVLLKGDYEKQRKFAELAAGIGQTITFDTIQMYRKLSDVGFGMMGGTGSLTADQVALAFTEFRLLTRDLGMFRVRDPDFQWMFRYNWTDPQAFSNAFRKSFFATNGLKITQTAMFKEVFEASLATPIARTTIPVVILGMQPEEEEAFKESFPHGYTVVDLNDKEVDEKLVTDTFITLRDTIKAKSQPPIKENN